MIDEQIFNQKPRKQKDSRSSGFVEGNSYVPIIQRWKLTFLTVITGMLCLFGFTSTLVKEEGMRVTEHFSQTYQEARVKFLEACEAKGGSLEHYRNPHQGPNGRPLFTDFAVLGPEDAIRVLVLGSGTHGVEGFCGSGLQTALLHDGIGDRLPDGVRLLFIHAINPYGFAWLRRFNEDNVDLNRNFVDHSQPYPENPEYEVLADAIAPKDYSNESVQRAKDTLIRYAEQHGLPSLQEAVTKGQYIHPGGIHFGGKFETWSNRTLRKIVEKHLSNAEKVVFVDFHTGLGSYGEGECILNEPVNSPAFRRARNWWGTRAASTATGKSVSADLYGTVKLAIPLMLPATEVTATSLEFGTFDLFQVFFAMQAENWLHNHGKPADPRREAIKSELRRVFYPDEDDWKEMVWEQAKEVVDQALAGLAGD